ncbi:MAG: hypothetical protein P8X82_01890, partial [Gemmatimonadales bacterium]
VTFDPRYDIPQAEQRQKLEVLDRVSQRQAVASEAMDRMTKAKESIDAVLELLDEDDSTNAELKEAGDSLKTRIDEVREEFTGPQDLQGFVQTPNTVLSKLGDAIGGLASYWGAATPSQMTYLQHAETRLQHAIDQVNQVLAEFAEFRNQASDLNLTVIKEVESLTIDWRPER